MKTNRKNNQRSLTKTALTATDKLITEIRAEKTGSLIEEEEKNYSLATLYNLQKYLKEDKNGQINTDII